MPLIQVHSSFKRPSNEALKKVNSEFRKTLGVAPEATITWVWRALSNEEVFQEAASPDFRQIVLIHARNNASTKQVQNTLRLVKTAVAELTNQKLDSIVVLFRPIEPCTVDSYNGFWIGGAESLS